MHFLLSYLFGELLVLLLGDGFVIYAFEELLDVLQIVLAGVVCVEVVVEAGDGSLGV